MSEEGQATEEQVTDGQAGDNGGEASNDWRSSLPETFRDAPFIKAAESPEDAVNQITNAASHMGNSIRIPSENASDEDLQAFYSKVMEKAPNLMPKPTEENMESFYNSMGRPEDPSKYKFEPPEGKEVPEDFGAFAKAAHEAGLSQSQFEKVLGTVLDNVWTQQENYETEHKQAMEQLNEEWGLAYKQNMSAVSNFLNLTDAPDGIKELMENGAMSPAEIKWLHGIATQTKSPAELANQQSERQQALTPNEARAQIEEISANNDHPYWNSSDPRHKSAVQRMYELQKAAAPGASTNMDDLRA